MSILPIFGYCRLFCKPLPLRSKNLQKFSYSCRKFNMRYCFVLIFTCLAELISLAQADITIRLTDRLDSRPLADLDCSLISVQNKGKVWRQVTSPEGICGFADIPAGEYRLEVVKMGQVRTSRIKVTENQRQYFRIAMKFDALEISEVTITATQGGGMTSSSVIGRDVIRHIQPSSFADLLELLPGGSAHDPTFKSAQTIRLREPDPISSYATSSLGTQFMIDGVPVNTDANLQSSPVSSSYGSSFVGAGVDMRSISTDNIKSVEIVRGIPSAEYGDLTSGLVKIERKQGGNDLEGRLKADMSSYLLSLDKGFEWQRGMDVKWTLNADVSYLDSHEDPRNIRQNYKRMTGSLRAGLHGRHSDELRFSAGISADYTGSFDNEKSDRDLNNGKGGPIERYKSMYNKILLKADYRLYNAGGTSFFRSFRFSASYSGEIDRIERWKLVELGMDTPVCTAQQEGEHDAGIVPFSYGSNLAVDGRPTYFYANATASFSKAIKKTEIRLKTGTSWNYAGNRGRGTIFDLTRPFSADMNVRPRVFADIPPINQFHLFAENSNIFRLGGFVMKTMAGIRAMTLAGLDRQYSLRGKWKFDPRINLRLEMPAIGSGEHPLKIALSGGWGTHTKFPTIGYLYPDAIWYDIVQLNWWPADPSMRRVNMAVFKIDPTNYGLDAARNNKAEVSLEVRWHDWSLDVTLFREDMRSGFRSSSTPACHIYKNYEESAIIGSELEGRPPQLSDIPYVYDTLLTTHSFYTNGSRTLKNGVEFTLVSPRIKAARTRISISGAYFNTVYMNSQPEYYRPSVSIGGKAYPYIGYYRDTDNYLRERFNTNLSTDTQVPRFGLILSTSFQFMWFSGSQSKRKDPTPIEYIDKKLERHPFTETSMEDGVLDQLVRSYNSISFMYTKIPFQLCVNLKVSKNFLKDRIMVALFANRIFDVSPSYYSPLGVKIRREVSPYFGIEMNVKL